MSLAWFLWKCVHADERRNVVVERHRITGAYRQRSVEIRDPAVDRE